MSVTVHHGDCLDVLRGMAEASVDSVVTDPPYGLEFMSVAWDTFSDRPKGTARVPNTWGDHGSREHPRNATEQAHVMGKKSRAFGQWCEAWAREVYRVMKPGAFMVSFGGTRTYHRMTCAVEDAGFEIRDQLLWIFGSGFPKSKNIGGGFGTALKPAHEPVLWAQKPFEAVPSWDILSQSTALIEAMLWSIAPAKFAALCFGLSRNECGGDPSGSARWIVAAEHGARSAALPELTAMFSSPETASTFLSIVWLWNGILAASSSGPSTFTTETRSSLTTGLRTLNCLISAITPESTIRAATLTNGSWWSADAAEPRSSGTPGGSSGTPRPSARESASWNSASAIASALASIAEASFPLHQVTRDCSAEPIVIRRIEPLTGDTIPSRTDLSPNLRPIVLARKPLACPTVAAQVLATGTGALNIAATRVPSPDADLSAVQNCRTEQGGHTVTLNIPGHSQPTYNAAGRWPANLCHDGSPEVLEAFGRFGERKDGVAVRHRSGGKNCHSEQLKPAMPDMGYGARGTAARFFPALGFGEDELRFMYSAKAGKADRCGSVHPTVKPVALMRWLCRLVTPPGGTVLDPFAGSGTTGEAALREGFSAVLIEREVEYLADIHARLARHRAEAPLLAEVAA